MSDIISADTLTAARSLVASEEQWTKHAYARNRTGHEVHHLDADAISFCSMGAVARALGRSMDEVVQLNANGYFEPLQRAIGTRPEERDGRSCLVRALNDLPDTTHGQILALFDRAVSHARHEGKQVQAF